MGGERNRGRAW